MKGSFQRIGLVLAGAALAAVPALTGTLAKEDLKSGVAHLEKTRQGVLDATASLSEAQWNFKQAPDRWSIAEVVEHIAASEDALRGLVANQVMTTPPLAERLPDPEQGDAFVAATVPDRSRKFQAPEGLQPTNRYGSPANALKHFVESRAETIEYLRTTEGLRDHAVDSPFGPKFDGYQWILFCSAHSERHTKQILEVKADPGF
ncbi:MAG: DinB family protein, partial [Terriglobia bacterium]